MASSTRSLGLHSILRQHQLSALAGPARLVRQHIIQVIFSPAGRRMRKHSRRDVVRWSLCTGVGESQTIVVSIAIELEV